jgi:glycerol-3-phosphate dehydrogenase (NAD(P)+)
MINEISVLGAGSWGTVLSELLAKNGKKIKIWTKNKSIYEEILNQNINSKLNLKKLLFLLLISRNVLEKIKL